MNAPENVADARNSAMELAPGVHWVGVFAPLDVLDYVYAVLHSPAYRERYREFLKIDFFELVQHRANAHIAFAEKNVFVNAAPHIFDRDCAEVIGHLAELPDLWDLTLSGWDNDSQTSRFAEEAYQEPFVTGIKASSIVARLGDTSHLGGE